MKSYRENGSGIEISGVVLCYGYIYYRIGIVGQGPTILRRV
jgi:hypothetical protein